MWRRLAPLALLALLLAGCAAWPTSLSAAFPATHDSGTIDLAEEPILVYDFTGTVAGVAVADPDLTDLGGQGRGSIDGDAIVVEWIGGACESRVLVFVALDDKGYRARIHPEPSLPGMLGCPAVGIGRAVRLQLREAPQTQRVVTQVDSS